MKRARANRVFQENTLVIASTIYNNTREDYTGTSLDSQY